MTEVMAALPNGASTQSYGSSPPSPEPWSPAEAGVGAADAAERRSSQEGAAAGFGDDNASASAAAASGNVSATGYWQDDEEVDVCPICNGRFTSTFRRHHCRQCGKVFCDDCSKHRVRLPKLSSLGKVRTCDPCFAALSDHQVTALEEDQEEFSEIISTLRGALSQRYSECEKYKLVLLELDREATGDGTVVQQYMEDKESDDHSFPVLRERTQRRWAELLKSFEDQSQQQVVFSEERSRAAERSAEAATEEQELLEQHDRLSAMLTDLATMEAERDEYWRLERELREAVTEARREVQELERERREWQELSGDGEVRSRWRSICGWSSTGQSRQSPEPGSSEMEPPQAFTISTGRSDPLVRPALSSEASCPRRLRSCRYGMCVVM